MAAILLNVEMPSNIPVLAQVPSVRSVNDIGRIILVQNETTNAYYFGFNTGVGYAVWLKMEPDDEPPIVIPVPAAGTNRGLFVGGAIDSDEDQTGMAQVSTNTIEYVTLTSAGNAVDFGDLSGKRCALAATSNGANDRAVFGGGYDIGNTVMNGIDYVTISEPGNASSFGSLTIPRTALAATSNRAGDRGLFAGGNPSSRSNVIDYINISSEDENAQDFGDLTQPLFGLCAISNGINNRALFAGGGLQGSISVNNIEFVTINALGNAQDFGDLIRTRVRLTGISNAANDRGVFAGGCIISDMSASTLTTMAGQAPPGSRAAAQQLKMPVKDGKVKASPTQLKSLPKVPPPPAAPVNVDTLDYVAISIGSNAVEFGKLTQSKRALAGCSNGNGNIGVFGGGVGKITPTAKFNTVLKSIHKISINTPANSSNFGELSQAVNRLAAVGNGGVR